MWGMIGRRGFLKLLPALVAAPALIRALPPAPVKTLQIALSDPWGITYHDIPMLADPHMRQGDILMADRDTFVAYYRLRGNFEVVAGSERTTNLIDDIRV